MKNANRNILIAAILGITLGFLIKNFSDASFYQPFMGLIDLLGNFLLRL